MNDKIAIEIGNAIDCSRMVAEMDKNRVRRNAKLAILRLVETDIKSTLLKAAYSDGYAAVPRDKINGLITELQQLQKRILAKSPTIPMPTTH